MAKPRWILYDSDGRLVSISSVEPRDMADGMTVTLIPDLDLTTNHWNPGTKKFDFKEPIQEVTLEDEIELIKIRLDRLEGK